MAIIGNGEGQWVLEDAHGVREVNLSEARSRD